MIQYRADGTVFLQDDTNTGRTQVVPPGTKAAQDAAILTFFGAPVAGPTVYSNEEISAILAGVLPLGPYTVATLPTPSAALLYRLATVTDLFGTRATRVRCEMVTLPNATPFYYWQPSSSDAMGQYVAGAGTIVLNPLSSPTSVNLTGTLGIGLTMNFTLGLTGGWPGAIKEVRNNMSSLLGSVNVLGTGLGSGVSVLLGGYSKYVLDYSNNSGQWIRLV